MAVAGIIGEYNPLHGGHTLLMEEARRVLGPGTAIVCCMSGDFVQRGDFAVVRRQARAQAAVQSGADLVLELPLPWAVSSAEGFARGAVETLAATGVVDHLVFGSECGNTDAIQHTAALLLREDFPAALRRELSAGDPFPAARQRAAQKLADPADREAVGAVLSRPNDLLAVEYCKALLSLGSSIRPVAVLRRGAAHGDPVPRGDAPSSSTAIRALLRAGDREAALSRMAPAMGAAYRVEEDAGRAPVFADTLERAVLARLRAMTPTDFAALDEGREGLCNRLYTASRTALSVEELLDWAKTRRYPRARLRRMVLWAFLGLTPSDRPPAPLYLRPLAMNDTGRNLLSRMRTRAALPVLTKPGSARKLGDAAYRLFSLEARAAALYALAFPKLAPSDLWTDHPWLAPASTSTLETPRPGKEPS